MAGKRQIVIEVVGNASSGTKALSQAGKAAGDLEKQIGGKASAAVNDLSSALTKKLGPAGSIVKGKLDQLGLSAVESGGLMQAAAVGGVAALGVGLIKVGQQGVKAFTDLAGQVRMFGRVAGTSAEESSKLVYASNALGVGSDNAAAAIFKLSKQVSTHADKLADDGVAVARNADGTANLEGTLLNAADAYKHATSAAQKNKIAFDAFGKSGAALIPILAQGRDGLQGFFDEADQHHQILSDSDLSKAKDLKAAMRNLTEEVHGLEVEVGRGLVPVLAKGAQGLSYFVLGLETVGGGIRAIVDAPHHLEDHLLGIGKATDTAKKSAIDYVAWVDQFDKAQQDAADSADAEAQSEKDLAKAIDGATNAAESSVDANLGLQRAELQVKDSLAEVADKTKALADARKKHGANSKEAKAAEEDLTKAQLDSVGAANNAAGAAQKVAENAAAVKGGTLSAKDGMDIYRANLQFMANAMAPGSPVRTQLQALIDHLPTDEDLNKSGTINLDTSQADAAATALKVKIDAILAEGHVGPLTTNASGASPKPAPGSVAHGGSAGTKRASGGPIVPGQPYTFNEGNRAEGIVFGAPGQVVSHDDAVKAISRSSGGSGGVVIYQSNTFHGSSPDEVRKQMEAANRQLVRELTARGVR